MDALLVNALCDKTTNIIKTMFAVDTKQGVPRLKAEPFSLSDISGMVGFSGDTQGSITLSFPSATALKMTSVLLGEPMDKLNNDVSDAIGELANIVAGNAKTAMPHLALSISLPQVAVGKNHVVSCQTTIPAVWLYPF